MRLVMLEILLCPACGGTLGCEPSPAPPADDVQEGALSCSRGHRYPIRGGIPRFVDSGNYAGSFGLQWNRFATQQLDSRNGTSLSARRFYSETGWTREWIRGKRILEVGCGAGRFLEIASRDARLVVGLDASAAVEAASRNLSHLANVELVQASLYAMPFRAGSFDGCYCIGVIQHTPSPHDAVRALARPLATGGLLALTAYERKRWTKLTPKYLLRRATTRLAPGTLLRILEVTMPVLFPLTDVLFRLPVLGLLFRRLIPVANYVDVRELSRPQRYDWATMDTFDILSPAFDQPQTYDEVKSELDAAGIGRVRRLANLGLNVVGVKERHCLDRSSLG